MKVADIDGVGVLVSMLGEMPDVPEVGKIVRVGGENKDDRGLVSPGAACVHLVTSGSMVVSSAVAVRVGGSISCEADSQSRE